MSSSSGGATPQEEQLLRRRFLKERGSAPTQRVRYEVEEGVAQQTPGGETEKNLQQILVLVTVGLNRDQEQDEERSRADQQGGPDGLEVEQEEQELLKLQRGRAAGACLTHSYVSVSAAGRLPRQANGLRQTSANAEDLNPLFLLLHIFG